jgi:hypothetical protein
MESQYDRITQILQSQSAPKMRELDPTDSASAFISALGGNQSYSDVYKGRQQDTYNQERQVQSDELNREMGILDVFERKKAAGDAQAQALDAKIKLFTGDDPEGMAIFLEQLHNDPDEIDAGNSYQVMTKLAGIAKRTGYKSPQMKQKQQMDDVNKAILDKIGGKSSPISVRNNNPGNMRPVGQDGGFQAFNSPQDGLRAMEADLTAKITGQSPIMKERYGEGYQPTLQSIIETWAPPSENDTAGYVNFVAQKTGLQPNSVLSPMDIQKLIPAMIEMEGGKEASQYYQPVQTADSGQIMNDGLDETTQLQVMTALASGDQAGALKIMADAEEKSRKSSEPNTDIGKMQRDEQLGLVPKGSTEQLVQQKTRQTRKEEMDAKAAEQAAKVADQSAEITKSVADTKIKEALDLLENNTLGVGGMSATANLFLPGKGTDADTLDSVYSTLKSVISLDKLMELKKASPTGASGFGALSAPELKLLTDSVAALDVELDKDVQLENIRTIQRILGYGNGDPIEAELKRRGAI